MSGDARRGQPERVADAPAALDAARLLALSLQRQQGFASILPT